MFRLRNLLGLFIALAMILGTSKAQSSLAYLDVSVGGTGTPSTQTLPSFQFVNMVLKDVNQDTATGWNPATHIYTIPVTGTYQIISKLRLADNSPPTSFAQGVNTTLGDGTWMVWNQFSGKRTTLINVRTALFTSGTQLQMGAYCDNSAPCVIDSGDLIIEQQCTLTICSGASAGVSAVNGLSGFLLIQGAGNTSVAQTGNTITISSTGGGGTVPTGTGFTRIISGTQQTAASAINLNSADVSGSLPFANMTLTSANIVSTFNSGTCSGYLKSNGGCDIPTGSYTSPTGTGVPSIVSGVQQTAAVLVCMPDGTNCYTGTTYNSEIVGRQASGGSDNIQTGPTASKGIIAWKNNEWELSNNNDALSRIFRSSDFTASAINTLLQSLTGCGTSGNVLSPQGVGCVAQSGGSSNIFAIPRDINSFLYKVVAGSNVFNGYGSSLYQGVGSTTITYNATPDASGYTSGSIATGTSANTPTGWASARELIATNPSMQVVAGLSSAANVDAWVALTYQTSSFASTLDPGGSLGNPTLGFRHFASTEATNWTCYEGSPTGSYASQTADTGVAVDTSKQQRFDIITTAQIPAFYINSVPVCTGTTWTAMSTTNLLSANFSWQNTTTASVTGLLNKFYYGSNQ